MSESGDLVGFDADFLPPPLPIGIDPALVLIQDIGKVKRNRGPGIKWVDIETENHEEIIFDTFEDVLEQVNLLNVSKLGEKSKKVYIYKCKFRNCPYRVRFMKRYDSKFDSSYCGVHNHDDAENGDGNSGNMRGLDDLQKKIVKEGFGLGIMSINQILKFFRIQRAKREATEKFPVDPDRRKLTNYVASLKKKNSPDDADDEDAPPKKKRGPGRPKRGEGGVETSPGASAPKDPIDFDQRSTTEGLMKLAAANEAQDSDTEDEDDQEERVQREDIPSTIMVVDETGKSSSSSASFSVSDSLRVNPSIVAKRRT